MKEKIINFLLTSIFFIVFYILFSTIWVFIINTWIYSLFYSDLLFLNSEKLLKNGILLIFIISIMLLFFRKKFFYFKKDDWKIKIANFFKIYFVSTIVILVLFFIFWTSIKNYILKNNYEKMTWEQMTDEKFNEIMNSKKK